MSEAVGQGNHQDGPYGVKLYDSPYYRVIYNNMMAYDVISRVVDRTGWCPTLVSNMFELPEYLSWNKHHAANLADILTLRIRALEDDERKAKGASNGEREMGIA